MFLKCQPLLLTIEMNFTITHNRNEVSEKTKAELRARVGRPQTS